MNRGIACPVRAAVSGPPAVIGLDMMTSDSRYLKPSHSGSGSSSNAGAHSVCLQRGSLDPRGCRGLVEELFGCTARKVSKLSRPRNTVDSMT